MFQNHLKIAFRQIGRNKVFSTINILGLSLGIAVVILIAVFVKHEYSYDHWMDQSDHTYRVYREWHTGSNTVWTPSLLAKKLMTDYPEVNVATGFSPNNHERLVEYAGNKLYLKGSVSVDSTFFQVLPMPFIHGDAATALNAPNGLVITTKVAKKIFGDANPMGEVVKIDGEKDFIVTGVLDMEDKNSHIEGEFFSRFEWYSEYWTGNNRATYVQLKQKASVENLEEKLTTSITELMTKEFLSMNYTPTKEDFAKWRLQPLNDVHLHSAGFGFLGGPSGSIRSIYVFFIIGFLVLMVAIVNYINLATARASQRAKEVGVKKVTGAERSQLTLQFVAEGILQASVAAIIGVLLAELLLPFFNTITDRSLSIFAQPVWILTSVLVIAILTGLLAGIYPAFVMSAYKPAVALKSNFLKSGEKGFFRKVLVTGQFAITTTLIIVMAFIYRQVNFMMEHELGFHPEQVMVVPLNFESSHRKVDNLKTRFESIPGIETVSTASRFPGQFMPDWGMLIEGRAESVSPNVIFSDADYAKTLNIEMVEGRFISEEMAADTSSNFFVNEAFIKEYNIENPIGTKLKFSNDTIYGRIAGVMKNFHFKGLSRNIRPLVMNGHHRRWYTGFKISPNNISETIGAIEKIWSQVEPAHPMRYSFLDEDFAAQYEEQQRFGQTILYATLLTLFIAMLGLFGLTVFNVERRTREIGIRKILGASVSGIVSLLSKDFLKLAGIAFILALPIGYYVANLWLEDFAYRTNLAWWVFLLAGIGTIAIGFLTVSFQSIKAALSNPVNSLRNE